MDRSQSTAEFALIGPCMLGILMIFINSNIYNLFFQEWHESIKQFGTLLNKYQSNNGCMLMWIAFMGWF